MTGALVSCKFFAQRVCVNEPFFETVEMQLLVGLAALSPVSFWKD